MADLNISNENKNTAITITNESKASGAGITWDEADMTWDEADFPWDNIKLPITKESKNTLNISNENKN